MLFFKVDAPFHIPTSSAQEFQFSHILTNIPSLGFKLHYVLTHSFSKYLHKACHTQDAGDTERNTTDSACPQEACNLTWQMDAEQMLPGGMNG